ncbi:MAG: DUF1592 domain-containing protein [Myxococcota bacterium]
MRWILIALALGACDGVIDDPPAVMERDPRIPPDTPRVGELVPIAPTVRRLTRDEYLFTILDVTGVALSDEDARDLPVDRPLEGFVNISTGQTALPDHVRAYSELAELIVSEAAFATFLSDTVSCADTSDSCAAMVAEDVGRLLFRRPLEERETTAFTALFASVRDEGEDFDRAARAVAQAMLQSPPFLYLIEREVVATDEEREERVRTVGGYEMASRLSYMLWGSAPDEELYRAAENGDLDGPGNLRREVERMLGDTDKVRRVTRRYMIDWARMESLPDDDGLKGDLIDTAVAFYQNAAARGEDLFALFETQSAHLTPELAEAYGLTPQGEGVQEYDLTDAPGRQGILGQPGVLAGMTNADGGAIVARGLFMQAQLFCRETPDPPASLQEEIDEFVAEQPENASDRQIAETRLMRTSCAQCHGQFDPLAYGLEAFDFRGTFRSEDEHGNTVRSDGWIPAVFNLERVQQPYEDFEGLMSLLAQNTDVSHCWMLRQSEYALGQRVHELQEEIVGEIADAVREDGGDQEALVRNLVAHDLFRVIQLEDPNE